MMTIFIVVNVVLLWVIVLVTRTKVQQIIEHLEDTPLPVVETEPVSTPTDYMSKFDSLKKPEKKK